MRGSGRTTVGRQPPTAHGAHNVRSAEVGNSGHGGELLGQRCAHCVNSWCQSDVNGAETAPGRH
ncbi:MAG TPA: hypothetical protein PLB21_12105, partial [Actinomycetota bacterium]|nr:hypothetical protein [Actinomycetota bacterium]